MKGKLVEAQCVPTRQPGSLPPESLRPLTYNHLPTQAAWSQSLRVLRSLPLQLFREHSNLSSCHNGEKPCLENSQVSFLSCPLEKSEHVSLQPQSKRRPQFRLHSLRRKAQASSVLPTTSAQAPERPLLTLDESGRPASGGCDHSHPPQCPLFQTRPPRVGRVGRRLGS